MNAEFRQNPNMTRSCEDIPMFWMLRPLGDEEYDHKHGVLVKDSNDIRVWTKSTIKRGMEDPKRYWEDGK